MGHGVFCSMPAALLINGTVENYSWLIFFFFPWTRTRFRNCECPRVMLSHLSVWSTPPSPGQGVSHCCKSRRSLSLAVAPQGKDPVILQEGALGTWSCYFPGPQTGFSHLATWNAKSYRTGTRSEHPGFHEPEVFYPGIGFLLHHFGEQCKLSWALSRGNVGSCFWMSCL